MLRRILLMLCLCIGIPLFVYAQNATLSGVITDSETGETLPGVNVFLGKILRGTATDVDGTYIIADIEPGNYLVQLSSIGYKTFEKQIVIKEGENTFNYEMLPDIGMLDEIVVAGVAEATPVKKMTVSVARVDADQLNKVPGANINAALAGKVSGITIRNTSGYPGSSPNIQLRSDNTLGGSDPMLVVDGLIMEGSLADLNTDDIANVEVVRGAAASALYGSRAANGVIVVTTKRGDSGQANKMEITVRSEYGVQELANTLDLADSHEFELADDYQSYNTFTKYAGVVYPDGYQGGYDSRVQNTRTVSEDGYMDNPFAVNYDPQNSFFTNGASNTNYISVGNRLKNLNFFTSFENTNSQGVLPFVDGYKRRNLRVNADLRLASWLKVSTSNLFINTSSDEPQSNGIFFDVVLASPDNNLKLQNPDGQPYYVRHNQWSNETNPLYNLWKNTWKTNNKRNLNSVTVKADPTDWMSYTGSYNYESGNYNRTSLSPYDTYNESLVYTQGSLSLYNSISENENVNHTLTLRKIFGDLSTNATFGYIWEKSKFKSHSLNGNDFTVIGVPTIDAIAPDDINGTSYQSEVQAENYLANISLDFKDRYLLNALYRRDGSSQFGSDARWSNFYRVSAAYRVTEDFKIPYFDELKLRFAQGTSGRRPGFAAQYETISLSNGTLSKNALGNIFLKPSITTETEFAINGTVLEKFNFEAIYSKNKTEDDILSIPLIPLAGFSSQTQNAADLEGETFEFNIEANWIRNRNFEWTTNFVFTKTEQKITKMNRSAFTGGAGGGSDGMFRFEEGVAYGAMYGRKFVRTLDQMASQLADPADISNYEVNSDGYVIAAGTEGTMDEAAIIMLDGPGGDPVFDKIGDGRPDFIAGLANTLNYKGFTLYFLLDIKKGGDVYNRKSQWLTRDNRNAIMDMAGVPENEKKAVNYFKSFYDTNQNNEYWVEDAGFVKLREVSLGYKVPHTFLTKLTNGTVRDAQIALIGRNLITWTDYSGYDPEIGSIRYPVDSTDSYPMFRQYSVSVTLKF